MNLGHIKTLTEWLLPKLRAIASGLPISVTEISWRTIQQNIPEENLGHLVRMRYDVVRTGGEEVELKERLDSIKALDVICDDGQFLDEGFEKWDTMYINSIL